MPTAAPLVFFQLQPSKLLGHLQRLLQTVNVLPSSLSRHVLSAPFAVQEWAQLLDPLAGLQAATGHFLWGAKCMLGEPMAPAQEVDGKKRKHLTCGT